MAPLLGSPPVMLLAAAKAAVYRMLKLRSRSVEVTAIVLVPDSATTSLLNPVTATGVYVCAHSSCRPVDNTSNRAIKKVFIGLHHRFLSVGAMKHKGTGIGHRKL